MTGRFHRRRFHDLPHGPFSRECFSQSGGPIRHRPAVYWTEGADNDGISDGVLCLRCVNFGSGVVSRG
jgi:hypothetical protein